MAARLITMGLLRKALETYVMGTGQSISEGEQDGKKRFILDPGGQSCYAEDGILMVSDPAGEQDKMLADLQEIITFMDKDEPVKAPETAQRTETQAIVPPKKSSQGGAAQALARGLDNLTVEDIIHYINPDATENEAYLFLEFCKRKKADPFKRQVHLAIFEGEKGRQVSFISGKEYFTEKAEINPAFDGFRAGIITRPKAGGDLIYREGSLLLKSEEDLIGGWAEVFRKDRAKAFKSEVPLSDYNTGKRQWTRMPATMIRKVALVQALREAFTADLGGFYDAAEMDQAIDADFEVRA
jgi:phage recombination protein Bet